MTQIDWARNKIWNTDVEKAFYAKLKRARDKQGYLYIQANLLVETQPDITLQLLEQYFALNLDDRYVARAYEDQGRALYLQGRVEEAVRAFQNALKRQQEYPGMATHAYVRLPILIALEKLTEQYDFALSLLEENKKEPCFPVAQFWWHGAKALLLKEKNLESEARFHAHLALEAASQRDSGVHHHPKIGLISGKDAESEFFMRVQRVANFN